MVIPSRWRGAESRLVVVVVGSPRGSMVSAAVFTGPEGRSRENCFPANDGRSVLFREHDRQHAGRDGGIGGVG